MTTEQELDRRINDKIRELRMDRERVDRVRGVVEDRDAHADRLLETARDLAAFAGRQRDLLDDLRDGFRHGKPGEPGAKEWESDRLAAKREEIADEIDSTRAHRLRVIERLDRAAGSERRARYALDNLIAERAEDRRDLANLRQRRARIEDDKDGQLTKDFHVEEFNCKDGTRILVFCPYIVPHLERMCAEHLQPLRDSGGAVFSNSALRPIPYNRSIGGADGSFHCYEVRKQAPAVDHVQSGRSASGVQQWHEANNPFDGMGFYSGFTHGDDRGYRSRWYGAG